MEDRKTRIAKLSERFKPQVNTPKKASRLRQRRSYYLANEIMERIDTQHKEFNHQMYPRTVSKSVFMEAVLEHGLNNLPAVRQIIEGRPEDETSLDESQE